MKLKFLPFKILMGSLVLLLCDGESSSNDPEVEVNPLRPVYQDAKFVTLDEEVIGSQLQDLGNSVFWTRHVGQHDTRYIALLFDQIKSPPGIIFSIKVLQEPTDRLVASFSGDLFAKEDSFVTPPLPPGNLRIELVAASQPIGLSFRLERVLWQVPGSSAHPQTSVLQFQYVDTLPADDPIHEVASAVALVHIGPLEVACTGVLIDKETVATNYHCIQYSYSFLTSETASEPSCLDVYAEFDYLVDDQRGSQAQCRSVRSAPALDAAFLKFDANDLRTALGKDRAPIQIRSAAENMPEHVVAVEHPLGLPLVKENCTLRGSDSESILHDCSSASGSSGSPIFDEKLQWLGLHYQGAYPDNWTVKQIEDDYKSRHLLHLPPRFNHAKRSQELWNFLYPSK